MHVPGVGPATNLLLSQYGIDPSEVEASGPKGLTKNDVMSHIQSKNLTPLEMTAPPPVSALKAAPAPPKTASGMTKAGVLLSAIPLCCTVLLGYQASINQKCLGGGPTYLVSQM